MPALPVETTSKKLLQPTPILFPSLGASKEAVKPSGVTGVPSRCVSLYHSRSPLGSTAYSTPSPPEKTLEKLFQPTPILFPSLGASKEAAKPSGVTGVPSRCVSLYHSKSP